LYSPDVPWHFSTQALLAACGPGTSGGGTAPLTEQGLLATVDAAFGRLRAAGVGPAVLNQLATASYAVAPLGGAFLGLADAAARTVRISVNAAGHGWFVDPTPGQDEEFRLAARGRPWWPCRTPRPRAGWTC
jgi:hypothetical protein